MSVVFTTIDPLTQERTEALFSGIAGTLTFREDLVQEWLRQETLDTQARETWGNTLLSTFASAGLHTNIVEALAGISPLESKNVDGITALMRSLLSEPPRNTRILIEHGADIETMSHDVVNPLAHALASAAERFELTPARMLLAAGASFEAGTTSLSLCGYSSFVADAARDMEDFVTDYATHWRGRLEEFRAGTYTPATREDWNHLASILPLDTDNALHPPSVAVRRKMLEEMRPDIGLGGTRAKALGAVHSKAGGI